MKKIFFMAAFVASAMAANAQWILGGQLGFSTNSQKTDYEKAGIIDAYTYPTAKSTDFVIAPTVSYVLNDKMQIGVGLNIDYLSNTTFGAPAAYAADKEAYVKTSRYTYGITPYFRYYFAQAGKFNFFCEAALSLSTSPRTSIHTYSNYLVDIDNDTKGASSISDVSLTITPGFNYRISNKWSADCYIDLAGIYFSHNVVKSYDSNDDLVSTDKDNTFGLRATATAQDLNSHLGNFRIGFNYHF